MSYSAQGGGGLGHFPLGSTLERLYPSSSATAAEASDPLLEQDDSYRNFLHGGPHSVLLLQIRPNLSSQPLNMTYWRQYLDGVNASGALGAGGGTSSGVVLGEGTGVGGGGLGISPPWMPAVGVVLGAIILSAVLGNGLVVTAVASFRRLRTVTNFFVVSLAIADILVAVLVMPYSLVYEVYGEWRFGWVFCYFWISCDVMCCTASILHLCVISLDRYLAITSPLTYKSRMSRRRALLAIALVWTCSGAISFLPIYLGWFADTSQMELYTDGPNCGLAVNKVYAVISASLSFYIPLVVMLFVYSRIYRIASLQAKEIERLERAVQPAPLQPLPVPTPPLNSHHVAQTNLNNSDSLSNSTAATDNYNQQHNYFQRHQHGGSKKVRLKRTSKKANKDFKALKTLGTLMGVFVVSWLPFFLMYVILPFCPACHIPVQWVSAITWLGYINSSINPCIYAYLNRDFRTAFRKLLFCGAGGRDGSGQNGSAMNNAVYRMRKKKYMKEASGEEFIGNDCLVEPGGSSQNNFSCAMQLKQM